ncbi:MAG: MGMT family protein [Rudaea sp.]|nr:MGMT family protein [Rudaea sp.]
MVKSAKPSRPSEHAAILRTIAAIPRGRVASYGEIAARAGLPRRARLVGRVLRESSPAANLPWQRVLRSDGRIAFPAGSRGHREQRQRLLSEGVTVVKGRVDLKRFGWQRDLDAELWAPRQAQRRNQPAILRRSRLAGSTS